MCIKLYMQDIAEQKPSPMEGELYKTITLFGKMFPLYYGYYEEFERYGLYSEPVPIYPNFVKYPEYIEDGTPLATEMQDICSYYRGDKREDSCVACEHFRRIEDLFGICTCSQKRQPKKSDEKQTQGGCDK